jgi:superfamily I DNA/RNA helicase
MERCEELGVQVYRPRNTRLQGDDLQRVVEYLALASSLQEGGIDHLALRALLELEDNDIGSRRLMTVVRLAMERGLRFGHALEYLRLHPELERRSRLGAVVEAGDEILERARRLSPDEDETLAEWLTRVAGHLGVDDATFRTLFALVGGTEDELEDEPIFDEPEHVPEPQGAAASHLEVLRDAMGGLAEAVPPQLPGSVTFTTMHGAKGLTADVVFVLQVEDEVIPGIDAEGTLDEMRRLLYVSLTRACQRRTGNQRYVGDVECEPRTVSRFIRDYRLEGISGEELVKSMPDIIGGLWD